MADSRKPKPGRPGKAAPKRPKGRQGAGSGRKASKGAADTETAAPGQRHGFAVTVFIPAEPDPPRRVFDENERQILGDPLADLFESKGEGVFVDPRAHREYVRRPGRWPKLTAERALKVLRAIAESGATYAAAAALAGIDEATVRRWRQKGKEPGADPLYRLFRAALARAVALSEGFLTEQLVRHARTDHRAAVAMLERRFPRRWGPPAVTLKGDKDSPVVPAQITFRLASAVTVPGVDTPRGD